MVQTLIHKDGGVFFSPPVSLPEAKNLMADKPRFPVPAKTQRHNLGYERWFDNDDKFWTDNGARLVSR